MAKVVVAPGRIEVREPMSPYDDFVKRFLETMGTVEGVLVSGYTAIVLGRPRMTEDIAMLLAPMDEIAFRSWWGRLAGAGFWCLQASTPENAWDYLENRTALRFADRGDVQPNMEVKIAHDVMGRRALDDAWDLDLLGTPGAIGDLSDQVAFKLRLGSEKDLEDAEHLLLAAPEAIDWKRVSATAKKLGVPSEAVHRIRRHTE